MAKPTTIDQIKAQAVKPLYAVAGATEVAYQAASGYYAGATSAAQSRLSDVQTRAKKVERDPKALQDQAVKLVNARVEELAKDAKDAQAKFEARVTELQKDARALPGRVQSQIDDAAAELTKAYTELAERGEKLVAAIRKDGVKAVTAVRTAPSKSTVARRENAVKAAPKSPAKKAAKKAPAKTPASKRTPAKSTATKSTATKSTASKSTASKSTGANSTAAKKTPAAKSTTSA